MTRQDYIVKWLAYALGLLPVLLLNLYILPWFPIFGTVPVLLPLAAVTVAVLEGPTAGAGFGLAVGLVYVGLSPDVSALLIFVLPLLGLIIGWATRYGLRQNLLSCLLCSLGTLLLFDVGRIAWYLLRGQAGLAALLKIAGPELLWSMAFLPLIYGIFRWISNRVPQPTVL